MLPPEASLAIAFAEIPGRRGAFLPAKSRLLRPGAHVLALVLSTGLPARAAADARDGSTAKPARDSALRCPSARTAADAGAAEHFAEFQCWFEAGQPGRALVSLEHACQGSDDPACLFNRALLHHALLAVPDESEDEHCRVARASYAEYLAAAPYETAAQDVKSALDELGQICAPIASSPAPAPAPPPPPGTIAPLAPGEMPEPLAPPRDPTQSPPRGLEAPPPARDVQSTPLGIGTAPLLCYGMSAVSATAAGYFLLRAWQIHDKGEDAPLALRREYNADQELHGNLAAGFGVASLLWLGAAELLRREQSAPKGVSLSLTPTFAGIGYEQSF